MRYTFTQPKTKAGSTDFYRFLEFMASGSTYNAPVMRKQYNMTFGAWIQAGLCKCENKGFKITEAGAFYVNYVQSTDKPNKEVLRAIIG